jgi:hypothetical protein
LRYLNSNEQATKQASKLPSTQADKQASERRSLRTKEGRYVYGGNCFVNASILLCC